MPGLAGVEEVVGVAAHLGRRRQRPAAGAAHRHGGQRVRAAVGDVEAEPGQHARGHRGVVDQAGDPDGVGQGQAGGRRRGCGRRRGRRVAGRRALVVVVVVVGGAVVVVLDGGAVVVVLVVDEGSGEVGAGPAADAAERGAARTTARATSTAPSGGCAVGRPRWAPAPPSSPVHLASFASPTGADDASHLPGSPTRSGSSHTFGGCCPSGGRLPGLGGQQRDLAAGSARRPPRGAGAGRPRVRRRPPPQLRVVVRVRWTPSKARRRSATSSADGSRRAAPRRCRPPSGRGPRRPAEQRRPLEADGDAAGLGIGDAASVPWSCRRSDHRAAS